MLVLVVQRTPYLNGYTNQRKYVIWGMTVSERILRHPPPTGQDVLSSVVNLNVIFGLNYRNPADTQWRKRNIFFELSYWKDNLIRHNLDLMHIEKNVGEVMLKWIDALK